MKHLVLGVAALLMMSFNAQAEELLSDDEIQSSLIAVANEMNQMTPIMVDDDTRLDSTIALKRSFLYLYTLVGYTADQLDPELFLQAIEPLLLQELCSSEDMAGFLDNDIDTIYVYRGNDGNQITSVTIRAGDCD